MNQLTRNEKRLWAGSVLLTVLAFGIFDRENWLTLAASLIGVTSLIFNAKGNPFGQLLMVLFSVLYGIISYSFRYYGEMVTYLGMTGPMALFSLIAWLRHPFKGQRSEVAVNTLTRTEMLLSVLLTGAVTYVFFFILRAFGTQNLALSTLSVATSFLAVYLTFRRSAQYALAYAANDVVLIALWVIAARTDASYISVAVCFVMFLVNDLYGYVSWQRMRRRQAASSGSCAQ